MAEKKFVKGSEEWMMFQDYWGLCQSVWEIEESDRYWEAVVSSAECFYEKYKTGFAKALALALINDLEKRSREMDGKAIKKT